MNKMLRLTLLCLIAMFCGGVTWATNTNNVQVNEDDEELVPEEGWTNAITNGNLAGYDVSCFISKEYPSADIVYATIVPGAGKNNSRGIVVRSADETDNAYAQDWDTQFWILLPEPLPEGTMLHLEFDCKASKASTGCIQAHSYPGNFISDWAFGNVDFTTEWEHFSGDMTIDPDYELVGMQSIAFNLNVDKTEVEYYFDNFGVWYKKPGSVSPPEAPTFSPEGGTYNEAQVVTLSAEEDAVIWFTIDGSDPTDESNENRIEYCGPIEIGATTTIMAVAWKNGLYSDEVVEATYEIIIVNEDDDELVPEEGWTNAITNGNLASDDVYCYFSKEYPSFDIVYATIVPGAGKNNSRGIVVRSADETDNADAQNWDTQFWILLPEPLPEGTMLHLEFDCKASKASTGRIEAHSNPGSVISNQAFCDIEFTTEWNHFLAEMAICSDDNTVDMQSIAFNLNVDKTEVDYFFDNFGVWYKKPTTGIADVTTSAQRTTVYTLSGQKVEGKLTKGVYVVNGRKVVIK